MVKLEDYTNHAVFGDEIGKYCYPIDIHSYAADAEEDLGEMYEKGCAAILNSIAEDGSVWSVSTGTPVMESEEAYLNIPCTPTLYGQSLAILAL